MNRTKQQIIRAARRYGVDPRAALAVASVEGGVHTGAVGDQGSSYGPFQLHVGGALPRGRDAAWANSGQGIDYAVRQMSRSSRGLSGQEAVASIVRNFERPAAPGAEISRAMASYGGPIAASREVPTRIATARGTGARPAIHRDPRDILRAFTAYTHGGDLGSFASAVHQARQTEIPPVASAAGPRGGGDVAPTAQSSGPRYVGKVLQLPTTWSGTHVTDNMDWNHGVKTAEDIMGAAGTPLGAPEGGTIKYFHPTGAQGGGSMLFVSDSGQEYWLGHIEGALPAGTRVQAGQPIALIAHQSVSAPHVHIDRRLR